MRGYMDRGLMSVVAALAVICLADGASGQQTIQTERPPQQELQAPGQAPRTGQAAAATQIGEHDLAHWVGVSNLVGLEVAQLGQQQATSQGVKQFAQKLAKMYQDYNQQVQQAAPGLQLPTRIASTERPAGQAGAQPGQEERREVRGFRGTAGPGATAAGGISLTQLHNELAQKTAQTMTQALGEKQGLEFDKAFIGSQVIMCMQMADTLDVFQRHAQSPQLTQVFAKGAQGARDLVAEAKQIKQQLKQVGQQQGRLPSSAQQRQQ